MTIDLLDSLIPGQLEQTGVGGLALARIEGNEIVYEGAFGRRTIDSAVLSPDMLFLAGSLAKPVFAYGVLLLVQRGEFDLDAPLAGLTGERPSPDPRVAHVTARHILSHSAGFPNWREGDELPMLAAPGQEFNYSGEGYEYLQRVIEVLMGAPLDVAWRELVFAPLGMHSSQFAWDAYQPPLAPAMMAGDPLPPKSRNQASAAWSLVTTVGDYARFLIAALSPSAHGLNDASLAAMLAPHIKVGTDRDSTLAWGLGWGLQTIDGDQAGWQWGMIGNPSFAYASYAVIVPRRRRGAVILTNGHEGLKVCGAIAGPALGNTTRHPALDWLLA